MPLCRGPRLVRYPTGLSYAHPLLVTPACPGCLGSPRAPMHGCLHAQAHRHTGTHCTRTHTTSLLLLTGRSQWSSRLPGRTFLGWDGRRTTKGIGISKKQEAGLRLSPSPTQLTFIRVNDRTAFLTWSWLWSRSHEPSSVCLLTPNTYTHLPLLVSRLSYPMRRVLNAFMRPYCVLHTSPLVSPTW